MLRGGVWKPRTNPYAFQGDAQVARHPDGGLAPHRPARRHRGDGRGAAAAGARRRRADAPGRRAQRAQLLAAARDRPRRRRSATRSVLLKRSLHMGTAQRVHLGRRVHRLVRKPERHPLPARHGARARRLPQPSRRKHHAAPQGKDLGAGRRRPVAFGRQGRPTCPPARWRRSPTARTASASRRTSSPSHGIGDDPKQAISPSVLADTMAQARQIWALRRSVAGRA